MSCKNARKLKKVIFKDLSKAFNTINHDLLLAKLKACGFSKDALTLMCSSLEYRKQRVIIKHGAIKTKPVVAGVPQRYIDDHLLFNIFKNSLALFMQYTILCNYADDNVSDNNIYWWKQKGKS